MRKLWLSIFATIFVGLFAASFANAQVTPPALWKQIGTWLYPNNQNNGVRIGTASRNLAAQQVTNDNGDIVDVEIVSLAAQGIHSGGPVENTTPGTPVPLAGVSTPCKHVTIVALGPDDNGANANGDEFALFFLARHLAPWQ